MATFSVLTQDEKSINSNTDQYNSLLQEANNTISLWQSELSLGIISDDDKTKLTSWISYIKSLQALDLTQSEITWPDKPQV